MQNTGLTAIVLKWVLGLGTMLSVVTANAQTPPPLEVYGQLPSVSSVGISPDGQNLVFLRNMNEDTQIVLTKADMTPIRGFIIDDIKARHVSFLNDNYVKIDVSHTVHRLRRIRKGEFGAAFSINIHDKEARPTSMVRFVRGLGRIIQSYGRVVGLSADSQTVTIPLWFGPKTRTRDLVDVDIKSGRGKVRLKGTPNTDDWFLDDQGNALAQVIYDNKFNIFSVIKYTGETADIFYTKVNANRPPMSIRGVMPDGSGLVTVLTRAENGIRQLMKLDFDGNITGPIIPDDVRGIESVLTDRNRKVLGVRFEGDTPRYAFLEPRLTQAMAHIQGKLPNAYIKLSDWSDEFDVNIYEVFDPNLGDVWLLQNMKTGELKQLANNRKGLDASQIADIYSIEYKARDGMTIPAIITVPAGQGLAGDVKRKLIVLPHGGPRAYDSLRFDWMAQAFASRGYVVLQPNFRGSKGYGRAHERAGNGEWGKAMQDDITDGVAAVKVASIAGDDGICIVGGSYGGYAALAGAVFTPELYDCVVAIAPVSDLNAMMAFENRARGRDHWVIDYWARLMADGTATKERLAAVSPAKFAERVTAPILLVHGNDDTVVPIKQSQIMAKALRKAKKDVKLVKLRGEDHWLSVSKTRLDALNATMAFVEQHLPVED